ncbi:MAG: hypothetical protein E7L17_13140 [Clostridium sp.]|uniref:hypothetical protein n=1 Tax=Clostridium sp. TaxID=1506 RepID=UPI0029092F2B|nr:hypothetical protein [Clostridium sp.]MDU7339047.1 hypothetical protein [Clostridium sp.]
MAILTVTPSVIGGINRDYPNEQLSSNSVWGRDHKTLFKFQITDIPTLYRKKSVESVNFVISGHSNVWVESRTTVNCGGSFSWINQTFSNTTNWNNRPTNGVLDVIFKNKVFDAIPEQPSRKFTPVFEFEFTPFLSGYKGKYGDVANKSLLELFFIGFELGNDVSAEDDVGNRYRLNIDSLTASISFSDGVIETTSVFPNAGGFVNPSKSNTFSVFFKESYFFVSPIANLITYEIKEVVSGVVSQYQVSVNQNLNGASRIDWSVPSSAVAKNKNYQWRAKIGTDGGETNWTEWAAFTTTDATPNAPIIKSPQSSYLDAASPIALTWAHDINTGSTQYAYDIDYKQYGSWVTLKSHVISAVSADTIPANTLEAGSFVWRVRTYNTDNVSGTYAESATNIVQARPHTPIIMSVSTIPQMVINWQSSGQQAYELIIGSEKIYSFGVDKSYTYSGYLTDGQYTIKLRVQNSQGLWSEYTSVSVNVKNVPISGEDVITATVVSGGVRIDVGLPDIQNAVYLNEMYVGEFYVTHEPKPAEGTRFLLRNGIPIAVVDGDFYIDYASAGMSEYVLRVVRNGNYYDSPTVYAVPSIKYGVLAAEDNPSDFIPLAFRLESKPQPQKQLSKGYNSHYFSGRAQPVYDITEHYETTWPLEYSMVKSNYDKLNAWVKSGKPILIRYNDGTIIRGVAQGFTMTRAIKNIVTVSFTVMQRDYVEAIDYV